MAENLTAVGAAATDPVPGSGLAGSVKGFSRTLEVTAAAAATSTYVFGYVPSNAIILGLSKVSWDDLASTGSPTLDFGTATDDDCFNDGLDLATAASTASLIKDIANYGKQAWDYDTTLTADPGGKLAIIGTLKDAAANTGGTVTAEVLYIIP
jgi:hypothetical protein